MLVMQEPMKASSILVPATSDRNLASSGSFGQQTMGSFDVGQVDFDDGSVFSASASASSRLGLANQALRRYGVAGCVRQRNRRRSCSSSERCSTSGTRPQAFVQFDGATSSGNVQPKRRTVPNACSTFRSGRPSISSTRPEKMFFLPALATVSRPALIAYRGMACTRSRSVMPGRMHLPLKRTSTTQVCPEASRQWRRRRRPDQNQRGRRYRSGSGVRVATSADGMWQQQGSATSGSRRRRDAGQRHHGRDEGWQFAVHLSRPRAWDKPVWQNDCMTRSAEKPRHARSFSSSRVIGPVVSCEPTVVIFGSQ